MKRARRITLLFVSALATFALCERMGAQSLSNIQTVFIILMENKDWSSGTNFGIFDDELPSVNHQSTTAHLVTLLNNVGISWKPYQDDITGTVCPLQDYQQYVPSQIA